MRTELKNIAAVRMGYSFRSRLERLDSGDVGVIQMKDLNDRNRVDFSDLARVGLKGKVAGHHLVRPGDLVFRSRGMTFTSAIVAECLGDAVVAAPLFVIRPDKRIVSPDYLNWFISQPAAQSFLSVEAKGTAQKMINKEGLENLEIIVPSLDRQRVIFELAVLAEREQRIIQRISHKRSLYVSKIMIRLAEGD